MPAAETNTQRLATHLIGSSVASWIVACRADGYTWRRIADELADITDRQVTVSHETIRQWADTNKEPAA